MIIPVGRKGVYAAITEFQVDLPTGDRYALVVGNMHIVCGREHPPTPVQRKVAVKQLAAELLTHCSETGIPAVRLLGGQQLESRVG